MNSWNSENYQIGLTPLMQPVYMVPDNFTAQSQPAPLIGPVIPDNIPLGTQGATQEPDSQTDVVSSQKAKKKSRSRDRSDSRRDKDRYRRRRSRSRDKSSRSDKRRRRSRDRKQESHHDRRSKWGEEKDSNELMMNQTVDVTGINMGMVQQQLQYQNMMNMMGTTGMDMSMMTGINMANMVPMDQNMLMINSQMNQQMNHQMMPMMAANQQIIINDGVLLQPVPGVTTPSRRERPKGCRTIFVGGLPQNMTSDSITEIFQRFGNIQDVKSPRKGVFYVRFTSDTSVEQSFLISGYRFRFLDQTDNEATTIFIDYALNREDQVEYERNPLRRSVSSPHVEPYTASNMSSIGEKIKSEDEFIVVAPTLAAWLERGECNKKNANSFYSLVQASNNQLLRLFNEKMKLDEEFQDMKSTIRERFSHILLQFEQVAKILTAAKHQRVSDHFSKQQRRNVDMWMKMTEELENMKEELTALFDDDDTDRSNKNTVPLQKYEELMTLNENLTYELEGYKNEAYLAKDEAERKFEKFKAHFIAQQALQDKQGFTSLSISTQPEFTKEEKPLPPPPLPPPPPVPVVDDDKIITSGPIVPPSEAKLISILTAFLMVHPLGASIDYLVSYVRSMTPSVTQATVLSVLQKYDDVFRCKTTGIGASIEHRWGYVTFDIIKTEQ